MLEYAKLKGQPTSEAQGTLNLLQARLQSFAANYPDDKRAWSARSMLPEIKIQAARSLGFPVDWDAAVRELDVLMANPDLPPKEQPDVDYAWISLMRARADQAGLTKSQWTALMDRMERFGDENPRHRAAASVHLALGRMLVAHEAERAERVLKSAAKKGDERIAAEAKRELAVLPYRSAPLDLQFTAVDGREVNVADLKGKVVLVDFWATWCGPCVRELPNVLAAYKKYHDKGFEIVGISLDDTRHDLEKFVTKRQMSWPQYYDGGGWDTKISRRFYITSIPTMWLLDREGKVISIEIHGGNLDYYLKRLLGN